MISIITWFLWFIKTCQILWNVSKFVEMIDMTWLSSFIWNWAWLGILGWRKRFCLQYFNFHRTSDLSGQAGVWEGKIYMLFQKSKYQPFRKNQKKLYKQFGPYEDQSRTIIAFWPPTTTTHHPPTPNFWKGSRPSRRLIIDM